MMMNVVYFKKYNTILFIFEVPHLAGVDHIPSEQKRCSEACRNMTFLRMSIWPDPHTKIATEESKVLPFHQEGLEVQAEI